MSVWTFNGTIAASLKVESPRRVLLSQAVDTFTFSVGKNIDEDGPFDYLEKVVVKKDGVQWFVGTVGTIPRTGSAQTESVSYRLDGPWAWLETLAYQQAWKTKEGSSNKSRYILGQAADGSRMTNGGVVAAVIEYAIACGVEIALGTVDPDISIPLAESVDMMCSEVIQTALRYSPDCVTWFDYTTEKPTFHCRKRSNLSAVTFDTETGRPTQNIDIAARYDLRPSAVVIFYEKTESFSDPEIGDMEYELTEVDAFPIGSTGKEPRALVATINLKGGRIAYITQKIKTREIETPTSPGIDQLGWWTARIPWLNQLKITKLYNTARTSNLSRELLEGQVQEWMNCDAETDTISAMIDYETEVDENNDGEKDIASKAISVKLTATNAFTKTYRSISDYESGEETPEGLAEKLYTACSELHFEGSIVIGENECSGTASVGKVLNIAGCRESWASMRALIQQVEEDLFNGETRIVFGPAMHLGLGDLIELLRANRERKEAISAAVRVTGKTSDSGSNVVLGGLAPSSDSTSGPGRYQRLVVQIDDKKVVIDPAVLSAGQSVQLREIDVCVDGQPKKARILMSEPY